MIWFILALSIPLNLFLLSSCTGGSTNEQQPKNPDTIILTSACNKLGQDKCNTTLPGGGYCLWNSGVCALAQQCTQVPLKDCISKNHPNDLVPGKICVWIHPSCTEAIDCKSTQNPSDCDGKISASQSGSQDNICAWFDGKCHTTRFGDHSANELFGNNQTICALVKREKIGTKLECWGDGANGKFPVAFDHSIRPNKILFADDFACAEVNNKALCWGNKNSIVNNTPTKNILQDSLRINNHVACAIINEAPGKHLVKCWGDLDRIVTSNATLKPNNLLFDKDYVYSGAVTGQPSLKVKRIALGSDFLCMAVNSDPGNTLLADRIVCSGKTNFEEYTLLNPANDFKSSNISELTAGNDFICLKKEVGPNDKKAYCFRQPGQTNTFNDTFLFNGAQYSNDQFDWIHAQNNYLCGVKADKSHACFVTSGGQQPQFLSNLSGLSELLPWQVFGSSFACGIVGNLKIKCWGNKTIVDGIPKLLSAP